MSYASYGFITCTGVIHRVLKSFNPISRMFIFGAHYHVPIAVTHQWTVGGGTSRNETYSLRRIGTPSQMNNVFACQSWVSSVILAYTGITHDVVKIFLTNARSQRSRY
jgi:hypothetical protein